MKDRALPGDEDEPLSPQEIRRRMKQMLAACGPVRQHLYEGRKLTGHLEKPPHWALHLERLRELENLLKRRRVEDWGRVQDLNLTFQLDRDADIAAARAEVSARMVGNLDWVMQRAEERKFEMSQEERDGIEKLMMPYADKFRAQMLDELPIAERLALEAKKEKLAEEGTE